MRFRQDINALRALAVILVILYHFGVPGFTGGFVGVDVFFVVSGYLMAGIILTALERGTFSFWSFYHARARRIIPALAVLCSVLLLFGFFYLPADEYRAVIREIKSSLLFYSNIELAGSGDYFATPPAEHWLLHTWSLSVEWQFYLLFPVFLAALHKLGGKRQVFLWTLVACVLSYIWSVYLTPSAATQAFYLLPSRAFEPLAGALAFMMPAIRRTTYQRLAACVGLGVIAASGILMSGSLPWPGYLAIIPVLGTVLVLLATVDLEAFKLAPIRHLGTISYSAYLWHWPVVVLLYFCGLLASPAWIAGGIAFSLIAATASYQLVERRFGKAERPARALGYYFAATAVLVLASAGLAFMAKRHPDFRPAALEQGQPKYVSELYTQRCLENVYGAADCILDEKKGDIEVILFGDSHAQSHAGAVQLENKGSALSWALGGCPLLLDFTMRDQERQAKCQAFNKEKLDILRSSYAGVPVVLFNYYSLYFNEKKNSSFYVSSVSHPGLSLLRDAYASQFTGIVCQIAKQHPVYLVQPTPEMPFSVYKGSALQRRLFGTDTDFSIPISEHLRKTTDAMQMVEHAAQKCGAKVIDPTPRLCPDGRCLGTAGNLTLYFDDNHLVDAGNLKLKGLFKEVFHSSKPSKVYKWHNTQATNSPHT